MIMKTHLKHILFVLVSTLIGTFSINAQIAENVYLSVSQGEANSINHELKLANGYLTYSIYESNPAKFIKTLGGFYQIEDNRLIVSLEFNSNYNQDSLRSLSMSYKMNGADLILEMKSKMEFKPKGTDKQELDGQWLFGTRGPDKGQERRGDTKPRKTLKFLQNGKFQWIAYNTETMKFHGTGGGSFISKDGIYQETIEYFSRDNSRVGAALKFDFEVVNNDWHHKGKNSKGEPMYEIWMRRSPK